MHHGLGAIHGRLRLDRPQTQIGPRQMIVLAQRVSWLQTNLAQMELAHAERQGRGFGFRAIRSLRSCRGSCSHTLGVHIRVGEQPQGARAQGQRHLGLTQWLVSRLRPGHQRPVLHLEIGMHEQGLQAHAAAALDAPLVRILQPGLPGGGWCTACAVKSTHLQLEVLQAWPRRRPQGLHIQIGHTQLGLAHA